MASRTLQFVNTKTRFSGFYQTGLPIYLKMGFRPDLSDAGPAGSPNRLKTSRLRFGDAIRAPNGTEGRILIRDTWNTEIVDELKLQPRDIILYSRISATMKHHTAPVASTPTSHMAAKLIVFIDLPLGPT